MQWQIIYSAYGDWEKGGVFNTKREALFELQCQHDTREGAMRDGEGFYILHNDAIVREDVIERCGYND